MIGSGELLVILVVVLILFGGKKLPEFAKSLGQGIREFKKACQGEEDSFEIPLDPLKNQQENKPIPTKVDSSKDLSPDN